ncbi:unnamed protein product, partial [marine sediment metagenome]
MDIWHRFSKNWFGRTVNITVLLAFISLTIYPPSLAYGKTTPIYPQFNELERISHPKQVKIDKDLGRIKTYYKGENGKLIIHLQDLHVNYTSQKQASEIIKDLMDKYGINLVLV